MDLTADFFSLFELPRAFRLNVSELDSRYRDVQAQVHPDRFANAPEGERRTCFHHSSRPVPQAWSFRESGPA